MKIFLIVLKKLALIGFVPNQQKNNHRIFSTHQAVYIFLHVWCTSQVAMYVFHVASGIEDYMNSVFTLTVATAITIIHANLAYTNDKIFDTIDTEETILNESEFQFLIQK